MSSADLDWSISFATQQVRELLEFFETKEALLFAIDELIACGGVQILAKTDHFNFADGSVLTWSPHLLSEDLPVLAQIFACRPFLAPSRKQITEIGLHHPDSITRINSLELDFRRGDKWVSCDAIHVGLTDKRMITSLPFDLFFLHQRGYAALFLEMV